MMWKQREREREWVNLSVVVDAQQKSLLLLSKYESIDASSALNFTDIAPAAFAPISFCQKITKLSHKYRRAAQKTFARKSCLYNVDEIDSLSSYLTTIWIRMLQDMPGRYGWWQCVVDIAIWTQSFHNNDNMNDAYLDRNIRCLK